jgi:hypothetical protein
LVSFSNVAATNKQTNAISAIPRSFLPIIEIQYFVQTTIDTLNSTSSMYTVTMKDGLLIFTTSTSLNISGSITYMCT